MPSHERKAIRDAVVATLVGNTDAGTRVLPSRKAPNSDDSLPQINVYTLSEETDPDSADTSPVELFRTVQVAVDCWSNVSIDEMEDALDALTLQVETAWDVADDDPASALTKATFWSWPASTEMGLIIEGKKPLGCAHMVYHVDYHSDRRSAVVDAARSDLKTVDTRFKVNPAQMPPDEADPTDLAEDQVKNLDT